MRGSVSAEEPPDYGAARLHPGYDSAFLIARKSRQASRL